MCLQSYESLLFSVSNKQKNMLIDKTEENDQETMYESTSKGLWKMSQKEFLLMSKLWYLHIKFCFDFFRVRYILQNYINMDKPK